MAGFGEMIQKHREAEGMTQRDLARAAKVTPGYIAQLETGLRTEPSRQVRQRLAKALGVGEWELALDERLLKMVEDAITDSGAEVVASALKRCLREGTTPSFGRFAAVMSLRKLKRVSPEKRQEYESLESQLDELFPRSRTPRTPSA